MINKENEKNPWIAAGKFLLTLLGPIWLLLLYWPWQLIVGIFGVCYYITIERTRNVIFPSRARRQVAMRLTWWSIPIVIICLVPALIVQIIIALWHLFVWWHRALGTWQTGITQPVTAVIAGLIAEAGLILVFIGSFHHPLPWWVMGQDIVPIRWYRFEAVDPVRILLIGPVIIGAFFLLLVPTVMTGLKPNLKKFLFLPCLAVSLFALRQTLIAEEMIVNIRWTNIGIGLFIALLLIGMMTLAWQTIHRSTALREFVWFSAIRLLEKKRIALFSLAAVTLCTAMLLIISSIMGGFVDQVRNKSHGLIGDIIIEGDTIRGFPYYKGFLEELKSPPLDQIIHDATPVIYSAGLMRVKLDRSYYSNNRDEVSWTNPVQVIGIDLPGKIAVTDFKKSLNRYNYGQKDQIVLDKPLTPPDKPDASKLYGLIYGLDISGLARRNADGNYCRYVPPYTMATLSLIPITRKGTLVDMSAPAITQNFYMIDDSRTGIYDVDSTYVYVDFTVLQKLLYMNEQTSSDGSEIPARAHQIQIKLKPGISISDALSKIQMAWFLYSQQIDDPLIQNVQVNTWEDYNRTFIGAVENEKRLMIIIFGIVSIVAVFLILAIFYMIVVEKTRDIGILKSIGASASQIAAIFLAYAGAIGFVGSIAGSILGYYFVIHINDIQDWLIEVFGWRVWNREVYAFDRIPGEVTMHDVVVIIIAAILASIVGAIIPAIRAARMNPVESLRYE
jgi:lipoprotein-releasing system permease protein